MISKIFDWPPVWMMIAISMVVFLAKLLPIFDIRNLFSTWMWLMPLAVGALYIVWAEVEFLRAKTTVIPRRKPTRLITSGPFKISRNPIYTGYAMIILAVIIKFGAISGIVALPFFVWVIHVRFIQHEEKTILENFGAEAKTWFENTRRW